MGNSVRLRALALVAAGVIGSWSLAGTAAADPKSDHGDHGHHLGQGASTDPKPDQVRHAGQQQGHHHGHPHAPGQQTAPGHPGNQGNQGNQGQQGGHGAQAPGHLAQGGAHGDPAGNNGTVKIAGPGDEIGQPSNNPHPGCTFYVEWFGFDEGPDVVSTVTFTSQAPTSDVVLGGTSPAQVFVGGDPAGGGTDLDGRQTYTLTFQGEPHPKQGYHVKLTVATPRSLGNDTKTKVFWVEPCAATAPGTTGDTSSDISGDTSGDSAGDVGVGSGVAGSSAADSAAGHGVLGETYTADDAAGQGVDAATARAGAAVPTAVDAGENGVLPAWARSPLPLTLMSFALVLVGAGMVLRNRSRA